MKKNWWKIVTVLLLVYIVVAGLLIPLKPSITKVYPTVAAVNGKEPLPQQFKVSVYNGNLENSKPIRLWLNNNTDLRLANSIQIISDQELTCSFSFSNGDNNKNFHLILETSKFRDTLPFAIRVNADSNSVAVPFVEKINPIEFKSIPFGFPNRAILNETIRNLLFHVPIWFAMILVAAIGMTNGLQYLRKGNLTNDLKAEKYLKVSVLMGILGLLTGSIWARFTWGNWWVFDVKLNGAAITVLIYIAYLVLRNGITDEIQRAKISAVYSIFAFVLMLLFVMIVPRIYDSLHPGNGGNPGANVYDLDGTIRMVFYPAVIAWMGLAVWISQLLIRYQILRNKTDENI